MLALGATAKVIGIAAALQVATLAGWWLHVGGVREEAKQAQTDLGACGEARDSAVSENKQWETDALNARVDLATCQTQWAEAKANAAIANAIAEERKQAARDALAAFQGRYAGRGQQCAAALAALDTACPELGGY